MKKVIKQSDMVKPGKLMKFAKLSAFISGSIYRSLKGSVVLSGSQAFSGRGL